MFLSYFLESDKILWWISLFFLTGLENVVLMMELIILGQK